MKIMLNEYINIVVFVHINSEDYIFLNIVLQLCGKLTKIFLVDAILYLVLHHEHYYLFDEIYSDYVKVYKLLSSVLSFFLF